METEVVRQSFDNEAGHVWSHLQGEMDMEAKSLISTGKSRKIAMKSRIQGYV